MHTMLPFYPSPLWAHLTSLSHDLITGGSHDHTAHYSISNLFSSRISRHLLRVKFLWFGKLWSCCGFYNIKFSDSVDKKSHRILMSWTLIPIIWYMTYPSLCIHNNVITFAVTSHRMVPSHHKMDYTSFHHCLERYANCSQRFGK